MSRSARGNKEVLRKLDSVMGLQPRVALACYPTPFDLIKQYRQLNILHESDERTNETQDLIHRAMVLVLRTANKRP